VTRTVCYFTDSVGFGGAEQALLTLMAGLDRDRWRPVLVYHVEPDLAPLVEGARDIDVPLIPVSPLPPGSEGARRVPQFFRTLRRLRPSVFHAHLAWPLAAKFALATALLARVPAVVATAQLFPPFGFTRATYAQHRLLARGIGRYIAVSHGVRRRLSGTLGWPQGKIDVIHNGIDVEAYDGPADDTLHAALSPDNVPIVLTATRLHEQKGLRYLLEAVPDVPNARFVVAGDGPERRALAAQADALGVHDRVVFLGHRDDVPRLLASCDVFVLPSLWEGLPLVLLEAMAARKPVVASLIAGVDEVLVPGETGLLVPPADPAALGAAIEMVTTDLELARQMARAGRARVEEEFSAATMVRRVTRVYDELLDRRGKGE
jgi:glycosyltransferase involved in cell wall biosynthesis